MRTRTTIGFSLGDIVSEIPGVGWVANTAIPGIGDFAKSELGFQVVSVVSLVGASVLLPVIGPAVIGIAMATPGLVAGDDFTTAFAKGLADSVEKLALVAPLIAGPAGLAVTSTIPLIEKYKKDIITTINRPEIKHAIDGASAYAKEHGVTLKSALETLGLTPEKFARDQGIREDVAAHALNANAHESIYNTGSFDAVTGLREPPPPPGPEDRSSGLNSTWALIELLQAQNSGAPAETVRILTEEHNRALQIEDPKAPLGSYNESEALTQVLSAQNRGAPPDVVRLYVRAYDRVRSPLSPELEKAKTDDQALRALIRARRNRLVVKQRAAEEGARLGQIKFGESAGSPNLLSRIGSVALVTSPFWLLVLLASRRYR
jgi:hypothetical protein